MKKIMIVHSQGLAREQIADLETLYRGKAELVIVEDTREAIFSGIKGVHGLIGCPRLFFDRELLMSAGESLCWIHVPGAGCEELIIPELVNSSITLTNGRVIQGPEVADHALALLLCLTRNIAHVLRGNTEALLRPIELRGKTALVIGCGGIGTLIAERAHAFGMKLIGVTPDYVPMLSIWERWFGPEDLQKALPLADVVFMAAPLTLQSEKMLGKTEFLSMKKDAFFVNVSRGKTVNTEALTQVLSDGHLRGVGLDVTDPEPLPKDHPLRALRQVIITPHIAGPSDKNRERSFALIQENIGRFLDKKALINIVNKQLGY